VERVRPTAGCCHTSKLVDSRIAEPSGSCEPLSGGSCRLGHCRLARSSLGRLLVETRPNQIVLRLFVPIPVVARSSATHSVLLEMGIGWRFACRQTGRWRFRPPTFGGELSFGCDEKSNCLARPRFKTATRGPGEMCREGSELDQPSNDESRQGGTSRTHIRARLNGQEPKQELADVPKRRREGNELCQSNCIRTRGKSAQRRTHIRAQLDGQEPKQQLADMPRCVGTATNVGKSTQRRTHIRARLREQEPKQQLADVPKKRRDGNELGQPISIRTRQVSANALHSRTQLHGQEPKQQLADVPKKRREGNEPGQPNSIRPRASQRKGDAQPSAVARTRTKTATGGCAKEASGWQRTRSAEEHQNAASQRKDVAHPSAVARARTKTATGRFA